jgi:integrase/recombinase XerD
MTSSLASEIRKLNESAALSNTNKALIIRFVEYMQTQTDTSEKYKRNNLLTIKLFAEYLGKEKDISAIKSKHEITSFLDTRIKNETIDPDKKWIGTWNDYLNRIRHFVRWLHNDSSLVESDWQTPSFVQIKNKKSKRLSPYAESELWERKDLLTVVKYESSKRNKAVLTLLWDFNARPHEVTRLKIKHIRFRENYGEAEIPHDSKTGSGPAMLTCSFPYVRDWLNEHPFRNEPEAKLICSIRKGGPMTPDALWTIMRQLRKRIVGLLESGTISEVKEKENLERIIKSKYWAPYCLRHSSITCDAETYPEFALRKKVRWSPNSVQPARYIKNRWGDDLRNKILLQNGIINDTDARPIPVNSDCARCQLVNPLENKYCSSCGYPLSVTAYEELKAAAYEELKAAARVKEELDKRGQEIAELKMNMQKTGSLNVEVWKSLEAQILQGKDHLDNVMMNLDNLVSKLEENGIKVSSSTIQITTPEAKRIRENFKLIESDVKVA